jgi:5'(3')-deoxyribonucleotidase
MTKQILTHNHPTRKLVLSLDLDNTIRDQIGAIITAVARRYRVSLSRDAFSCWDPPLGQILGLDNDQFTAWAWTDPAIFTASKPMPGVVWALHQLRQSYHLLILTSTAHPRLTEPWLRAWRIPYDQIIHTADKSSVPFHLHLDDSPTTLVKLSEAGRRVLRFALPWNTHLTHLPTLPRWSAWPEVFSDSPLPLGEGLAKWPEEARVGAERLRAIESGVRPL